MRFVEDPLAMQRVPALLALRHVRTTCRMIEAAAKRMVPFDRGPNRARTGAHLRNTIESMVRMQTPLMVQGRVGSSLPRALVVHEGARPHPIVRGTKKLKFVWPEKDRPTQREVRMGMLMFFDRVNHPGMRGTKYLTTPLRTIGMARGYRVTTIQRPS